MKSNTNGAGSGIPCAHICKHYRGCDRQWYIQCSVFDCDKPSDECGEDCCEYDSGKESE